MSDAGDLAVLPQEDEQEGEAPPEPDRRPSEHLRRDADLLGRKNSACRKWLRKRIEKIVKGFENQAKRSDDIDKWWNIYFCRFDDNQYYNGTAQCYVPIIRDAVKARATRFVNQLFPQAGRCIDATTSDGSTPWEIIALVESYIDQIRLKTEIVKPLLINGDIEGQYNLYVDWEKVGRTVVRREMRPLSDPVTGAPMPGVDIEDIIEEDIEEGRPALEVLHDSDVLIRPGTVDNVEQALAKGGDVTIVRRWSEDQVEDKIDEGLIEGPLDDLPGEVDADDATLLGTNDIAKKVSKTIGVRGQGRHHLFLETWLMVPLSDRGDFKEDGRRRLCRMFWSIDREPRGLRRNPYWNDRCPLLSAAVEKTAGVMKGPSLIEPLASFQYEANDAANERADTDHFASMPIIARRPGEQNAPLILNLAAIWDVAPGDIQFMPFPDLSQRGRARIMDATTIIFQSLSVTPAMLPQQSGRMGQKRNQAEVAMEQQVELLSVAEAVEVPDQCILSPLASWIVDLDHQFRDREMAVRAWGEMGMEERLVEIGPIRNRHGVNFSWCGAQQAKQNAAMMQGGIALLNVARGLAPQLQSEGYQLRLGPVVERAFSNVYGPKIGRLTLVDRRHQQSIATQQEIQLMLEGFATQPHPQDDDRQKIMAFQQAIVQTGDPHGLIRERITAQQQAMQAKAKAMIAAAVQQAMQGQGQPGPGGPGAGMPQPGAAPAGPRQMKQAPGAIHPDRMPGMGGIAMPRKM
jgi:hypothetical protein